MAQMTSAEKVNGEQPVRVDIKSKNFIRHDGSETPVLRGVSFEIPAR